MQYIDMVLSLLQEKRHLTDKANLLLDMLNAACEGKEIQISNDNHTVSMSGEVATTAMGAAYDTVKDDISTINQTLELINDGIKTGFDTGHIKRPSWDD